MDKYQSDIEFQRVEIKRFTEYKISAVSSTDEEGLTVCFYLHQIYYISVLCL